MANNLLVVYSSYSSVLFEYAKKEKAVEKYFQQAQWLLDTLTANNSYLVDFLTNVNIDKSKRKEIIELTVSDKITKNFKYLLFTVIDFDRVRFLVKMLKKFLKLCGDYLKITYVKVYSPFLLEAKQQERLQKALEKYYGTKIIIQNYVDPKLIGGIKIETDFGSIDDTYANKLKTLKEISLKIFSKSFTKTR